ncbi:hypothetical protein EDC04DRAFT_2607683 [Pisolithus marmoratus]|nr:hypothetical protein EDC04DRAFT_2607683 [Pisolithus marmoratus]
MVERLLEFEAFCECALQTAFVDPQTKQPNREFSYTLTDAFTYGFKARMNKPAELIAKHLDRIQTIRMDPGHFTIVHGRGGYFWSVAHPMTLKKATLEKLKEDYDPELGMGDHTFNDLALSRDLLYEYHSRLPGDMYERQYEPACPLPLSPRNAYCAKATPMQ